jgi:hypothetical protein
MSIKIRREKKIDKRMLVKMKEKKINQVGWCSRNGVSLHTIIVRGET